ncbi:MAG: hypothetical protein PHV71_01530 [Eubacteriales bacterium]|nr:hypothetical protein [Eubacteriales bacterium]MDD3198834.1 hypothetical protein [Eubacteriales bacterium]MDD4629267.1 hypothetical protein [Eubacteriales bacterium]
MFCDKLDFLMKLTNTSNSAMGAAISLDPSHISRLRNGGRRLPKNPGFLASMSEYLASRITTHQQQDLLMNTAGFLEPLPSDPKKKAAAIAAWLNEDSDKCIKKDETYISLFNKPDLTKLMESGPYTITPRKPRSVEYYFGVEGKREAVVRFLDEVISSDGPQTLLLYSDETMKWLNDIPEYAQLWKSLLGRVIASGHKIKIIHTVNRNVDEMFQAFIKWMPVYFTGAVQPYYCPKIRDGLFAHTMFIAPNNAAITVTTSRIDANNTFNLYHTDKRAILSLVEEYEGYLSVCKPLMRLFTPKQADEFFRLYAEFDAEQRDITLCSQGLSISTLPPQAAGAMADRIKTPGFLEFFRRNEIQLKRHLESYRMFDIIKLPDLEISKSGKVPLILTGLAGTTELFYTPYELKLHLKQIVMLLKTYENYDITIDEGNEAFGWIYAKEELGAIVAGKAAFTTLFIITEQNMSTAFWDYLQNKVRKNSKSQKDRIIKKIEDFAALLD